MSQKEKLENKLKEVAKLAQTYNCNVLNHLATSIKYQLDNKMYWWISPTQIKRE